MESINVILFYCVIGTFMQVKGLNAYFTTDVMKKCPPVAHVTVQGLNVQYSNMLLDITRFGYLSSNSQSAWPFIAS